MNISRGSTGLDWILVFDIDKINFIDYFVKICVLNNEKEEALC